jgi:serpin B
VVSLPAHGDVAASVLLPDTDLAAAEAELDADLLGELLDAPVPTRIELHLPKFEASASVGLDRPLRDLGVRTLFTNAADLSGLAPGLRVSAVLHQAVLRVDEAGLEGAAATAVMVAMAMAVRQAEPPVVRVDRPFLVAVRHVPTGAIYFLARIVSP